MVRNDGGGNKMKHLARKHVNGASQQQNKFLRVSQSKDEIYGYILRLLGNGMCMVKCVDGYERLCHIRGKFTGRSKRENALSQGTWVLIGLRQWDADKEFALKTSKTGKSIQKCDLLEIYTPAEREKLRVQEKIFQELADETPGGGGRSDSDDEFRMSKQTVEFKDQTTLEYQEIIEQGGKLSRMKKTSYHDLYEGITSDSDSDSDDTSSDDCDGDARDHPSSHSSATKRSVPDLPITTTTQNRQPSSSSSSSSSSKMILDEVDIDDI
jgi:initiation factor 1A